MSAAPNYSEVVRHKVTRFDYDQDVEPEEEDVIVEPEVQLDTTFGNVIVVDNVPITTEDKFQKLTKMIRQVFGVTQIVQFGQIAEEGLYIPVDEQTKQTKG